MGPRIIRLSPNIGAEVTGIDLSRPLSDDQFDFIHRAFLNNCILLFRCQKLTPEQHVGFSRRFGDLEIHVMSQFLLPGHPEVLVLSNDKDGSGNPLGIEDAGRYWHTDLSYKELPSLGSLLYAHDVPPEGGDTMFASMYAAYEALSHERQEQLAGLKAIHHFGTRWHRETEKAGVRPKMTKDQLDSTPPVEHPVVRTHPDTGRKTVYAGGFAKGIVGMSEAEGRAFVEELTDFASQDAFVYRHKWRVGDLILWDNRCAMHCATDYDSKRYRRHMHRTTVRGTKPH